MRAEPKVDGRRESQSPTSIISISS